MKTWLDTWWGLALAIVLGMTAVAVFELLRFRYGGGPLG